MTFATWCVFRSNAGNNGTKASQHGANNISSLMRPKKQQWLGVGCVHVIPYLVQLSAPQTPIPIRMMKEDSGWWLNQPIWKICSSNWIISPGRGENKKIFELPPPRDSWLSAAIKDWARFSLHLEPSHVLKPLGGWTIGLLQKTVPFPNNTNGSEKEFHA